MPSDTDARPEDRLEEALAERARLWEELHRLRAEQRELEYYRALVAKMETSLSWQVTAPLRQAKALSMRLRKTLDERRG